MFTTAVDARPYAALSELLEYPRPGLARLLNEARALLGERFPTVASEIAAFEGTTKGWTCEHLEEAYTRAFDCAPIAAPYLSVYLFGPESFKRAELMSGFMGAYSRTGFNSGTELPDHVATVLRYALSCDPAEWEEIARWCLRGPIEKMSRALAEAGNPYAHLLRAVDELLDHDFPREVRHA